MTTAPAKEGVGSPLGARSRMAEFQRWLAAERGQHLSDYESLWAWSVEELEAFWLAIAEFFEVGGIARDTPVLRDRHMPGATWFEGATVNFAREVFRRASPTHPAVVFTDESGALETWSWERLERETTAVASWLRRNGVRAGERVVGYIGNRPEALTAFLACASVGAVWAVCNQDVSAEGASLRFGQLEPAVLLTATSSRYAGRDIDHSEAIAELVATLPSLRRVLVVNPTAPSTPELDVPVETWAAAAAPSAAEQAWEDVPFEHPLWVLFSSGTTGAPKGLVHGHGGIVLQQLVALGLHFDVREGDRFFWYCSTSWVMWNLQVACLLVGATAVLYDGSPTHPDVDALWRIAARHRITHLGVSPGLLALAQKRGGAPADAHDLTDLRVLGVTGAPLPAATARWARTGFRVPLNVISGGTDVATAFVGANPLVPEPEPGWMGPAWLGVAARAVNEQGRPVLGDVGELVVTKPMPSMPLYLWNDPGMQRYRDTYFDRFPELWRQGDWATFNIAADGNLAVAVHGRSDATLNRGGIRLGTAEIYAAVEGLPEVVEALVVGVEQPDGGYWMPMFVQLAEGVSLESELVERLRGAIRKGASARHVPDELIAVRGLPHTLTGKRLEVPVKRVLMGHAMEDVVAASAVDDPELLAQFEVLARGRRR